MPEQDPASMNVVTAALHDSDLVHAVMDQLEAGIYVVDRERRILDWNVGAEKISGYRAHEVTGKFCHADLLMHCDSSGAMMCGSSCPLTAVMEDGKARECTIFLRHRHGHRVSVQVRSRPIRNAGGEIIGAVEVFEETPAAGRDHKVSLESYGCLDPVTGVPNRRYGELKVQNRLEIWRKFGIPFGWLRVSLDAVEENERRFGHGFVDAVMPVMARTFVQSLGPSDRLTRWSRTEFRIAVHAAGRQVLAEVANVMVVMARSSNVEWWGEARRVTVSIGGDLAESDDTLDSLELRVGRLADVSRDAGGDRCTIAHFSGDFLKII